MQGYEKIANFRPTSLFISEMVQVMAIVTRERIEIHTRLSNCAIFIVLNDLTQISKSRHYSTLNISETVRDRGTVSKID